MALLSTALFGGALAGLGLALRAQVKEKHALAGELVGARTQLVARQREQDTWRPAHVQARVRAIFHAIEQARETADACHVEGFATPRGTSAFIAPTLFKAGAMVAEPRRLDVVAIACVDDQPGAADDALWVTVQGLELRCDEPLEELWKLVRGRDGDWALDEVTAGPEEVAKALAMLRGAPGAVGRTT